MDNKKFTETLKKYSDILNKIVPIVDKVHGSHHPEFHTVKKLVETILEKSASSDADLTEEFSELRKATGNYTVPDDVCETYAAVYKILGELDGAYNG